VKIERNYITGRSEDVLVYKVAIYTAEDKQLMLVSVFRMTYSKNLCCILHFIMI